MSVKDLLHIDIIEIANRIQNVFMDKIDSNRNKGKLFDEFATFNGAIPKFTRVLGERRQHLM